MSKRLYALITGVLAGCATIAEAIVAFTQPTYALQIATAIPIITKCVDEVLLLFVPVESNK